MSSQKMVGYFLFFPKNIMITINQLIQFIGM